MAQIARGIVSSLRGKVKSEDKEEFTKLEEEFKYMERVVETAALIHDVGNPPFGHHGERVLNSLSQGIGFEGNAQGIRVIRKLEKKSPAYEGLNLTYRTMAAILKYNVKYSKESKKFIYPEDYEYINSNFKASLRTIDVQVVDLADEIAYCGHDLEDALASRYFTIDKFLIILKRELKNQKCQYNEFVEWVEKSKKFAQAINNETTYNEDDYNFYFRRELLSTIVHNLIEDIGVVEVYDTFKKKTGSSNSEELGFIKYRQLSRAIKKAIFINVTASDDIILYENVGTKVLTKLFVSVKLSSES